MYNAFVFDRTAFSLLKLRLPKRRLAGPCKSIMRYLLTEAQHSPGNLSGIKLERGQLIAPRTKIAEETGLSEQTIRSCLSALKSNQEVTSHVTKGVTIITVINYDSYDASRKESNQQFSRNQPVSNQPKEYKEEKGIKEKNLAASNSVPSTPRAREKPLPGRLVDGQQLAQVQGQAAGRTTILESGAVQVQRTAALLNFSQQVRSAHSLPPPQFLRPFDQFAPPRGGEQTTGQRA
jgi:hypothetical protein